MINFAIVIFVMSDFQLSFDFGGVRKEGEKVSSLPFSFVDLFCGVGGIRLGFDKYFGDCVFSSEVDVHAQKTYRVNFGELPFGDIRFIDEKDVPRHDILLAGFPCQAFSRSGLGGGFEDARGTLFFEILRILRRHRPKVVFLENVKGFRSHDQGRTFGISKKLLEDLGYRVYSKVLRANDFGVPQKRERIYIICFLEEESFSWPIAPLNRTNLGSILEENVAKKYTLSDRLWGGHQRRKREHLEKGNGFGYCLFNERSEYTSTLLARYYKDGSEILIEQLGKNPRKLTPREAARLQGFPDSFIIPVSDTQAYKQFGNSVSVPVIKALAREIAFALHKK